jgi:hypothetical protein
MCTYLANLCEWMRAGEASGGGVEVRDDLLQVLRHPLQLTVQVLCQLPRTKNQIKLVISETKVSACGKVLEILMSV